MPSIFLTGATGQIGEHVSTVLAEKNKITALARGKKGNRNNPSIEWVEGDITRPENFSSELGEADVLIHMAALTRSNDWKELFCVNVQGALDMVHAAHESGIKKIIVISSASVTAEWLSPYAKSKKKMEDEIRKLDFPVTIVRPTLIYFPGSPALQRIQEMTASPLPFIPLPNRGEAQIRPIHARDLGAGLAFLSARKSTSSETFDLGCAEPFTLRQLFETILHAMGHSKPFLDFPPAPLIQLGKKWADSQIPAPYSLLAMLGAGEGYRIDPGPFLRTSRLSFIQPEEGIRQCLKPNPLPHQT